MCGGWTRSWSQSSMSAKRSPGVICGRSLMVRRSLPYDEAAAPLWGAAASVGRVLALARWDSVGRSCRLRRVGLLHCSAAVIGGHRLALQLDGRALDDADLCPDEAGVRRVGEAERHGARPLRQPGLNCLHDAVSGWVRPGGLQRLSERVGHRHAVEDVAVERQLGDVLVVDLLEQLDPAVVRVCRRREVAVGDDALDKVVALDGGATLLGERLEQPGQRDRVGTDVADGELRVEAELQQVELEERGVGRHRERHDEIGLRGRELLRLRLDVDVADLVGLLGHDLAGRDLHVETLDAVLAEVVVLVEVRDLLAGEVLLDVVAQDLALDRVVGLPAERVGVLGGVVPAQAPGGDEEVRHLLLVEEVDDLLMSRRAERVEDGEDLVGQDQLLGLRDRLARVVAVVDVLVDDLATVDAPVGVDEVDVGLRRRRDLAVARRGNAGQRLRAADGDARLRDAGRAAAAAAPATAAAAPTGAGQRQYGPSRQQADVGTTHVLPPWGSGRGRSSMRTYLAGLSRAIRRRTDPTMPPGATSMARASRTP